MMTANLATVGLVHYQLMPLQLKSAKVFIPFISHFKFNCFFFILPFYSNAIHVLFFFSIVLEYEKLYLENLPDAECYEKSYMHRDVVTHVVVTKTDFIVTASVDGHLKFWKKMEDGIEFVKHFRSHLCT